MQLNEIAFFVEDVEGTTEFYSTLLAAEPVAQSEGMSIFMTGGTKIFIHRDYEPGEGELPPENHIAFTVANVETRCQQLVGQGLSIEIQPVEYYWGKSAYLRAPDGQLIELIENKESSDE